MDLKDPSIVVAGGGLRATTGPKDNFRMAIHWYQEQRRP
jgi:hypothetical protein